MWQRFDRTLHQTGYHLLVTLEAIETGTNRVLWQTNLNGSTQDPIALQHSLAKQVRTGLLPMLGAAGGFLETSTRPAIRRLTIFIFVVLPASRSRPQSGSHPIP